MRIRNTFKTFKNIVIFTDFLISEKRFLYVDSPKSSETFDALCEKSAAELSEKEILFRFKLDENLDIPDELLDTIRQLLSSISDRWEKLKSSGWEKTNPGKYEEGKQLLERQLKEVRDIILARLQKGDNIEISSKAEPYGEEHLKAFTDQLAARVADKPKVDEFRDWTQGKSAEELRMAGLDAKGNARDFMEKHVRLASEFLSQEKGEENINGHATFKVDFKGNEVAEWKIGAGHVLPPTIKAIRVYDQNGDVLFDKAERKVEGGREGGRVGYFTPDGQYAYIHTGYKIEILEVQDVKESGTRIQEENELFALNEQKLVIKENLQAYFKDRNLSIEVDDVYFESDNENGLGGLMRALGNTYLTDYANEKLDSDKLKTFFDAQFEKDAVFMENISHLLPDSETLYLSQVFKLFGNAVFAKLKDNILTKEALEEFKAKNLGGKDVIDYLIESTEPLSDELFVTSKDHFGNVVTLRFSAMRAFKRAMAIASAMDPSVKLKVVSSYNPKSEIVAFKSGGALEIEAFATDVGGTTDQELLKRILPQVGFVNTGEGRWEIYTARWKSASRQSGPVYGAVDSLDGKPVSYDDYRRQLVEKSQVVYMDAADRGLLERDPTLDGAFRAALLEEAGKAKLNEEYYVKGKCEHNACNLAKRILNRLFGIRGYVSVFYSPLLKGPTMRLRGRKISSLTGSDFEDIPVGAVFFCNTMGSEISSRLGTDEKVPKVTRKRHWFTYAGKDSSGKPAFVDNWKNNHTLGSMKSLVGDRVVCNVHDPYAKYRDQFVAADGRLTTKARTA